MGCQLEGAQQDTIWATSTVCIARRCHWYINIGSTCFMIGSRFNEDMHLHSSQMTAVGFEPTPLRTGAWSQRLRPLGQTVILKSSKCYHQCFCYFFGPRSFHHWEESIACSLRLQIVSVITCAWTSTPQHFTCALLAFLRCCAKIALFIKIPQLIILVGWLVILNDKCSFCLKIPQQKINRIS